MKNSKTTNRIWFKDNPWPDGHALAEVAFHVDLLKDGAFLHLGLTSEDYSAQVSSADIKGRVKELDELLDKPENQDNWKAYESWENYHSCSIEPNKLPLVGDQGNIFSMKKLSKMKLVLDDPPPVYEVYGGLDFDNFAFHCYILGHDLVGHHHIKISPAKNDLSNCFDIDWVGKIALAYSGDEEFRYSFKIEMKALAFAGFCGGYRTKSPAKAIREKELRNRVSKYTDIEQSKLAFVAGSASDGDWLIFK